MRSIYKLLNATPVRWLIILSWMVVLTILLLQPLEHQIIPTGIRPAPPSFTRELYFSTVHALFFAFTCVLWSWTLHQHFSLKMAVLSAALGLFIYGIGTEIAQAGTPGRGTQGIDVLADGIGASSGAWLYYRWISGYVTRLGTWAMA